LAPDAAQAYFWRGWVKERNDSFEGAVKDYETAVELAPQVFLFRHRAAEILLERSNPPLARPHLEYLQHHFPNRPEVKALLGHCRFVEGKWEEARPLLEEAVKKMPDHPPLLTHLAKLDLQEGRPEEAEKWLRHLLELEPFDLDAQNTLVISLRQQGRQEEAAAAQKQYENSKARLKRANDLLKEMAEKPPEEAGKPSEVGQILISIGRDHIGLFWLDRALLLDPGHQPTHQALADYFERKGQKVQADLHRRYLKEPPSQRR
jgi:tetratricopeptide (TPR) repeat protein